MVPLYNTNTKTTMSSSLNNYNIQIKTSDESLSDTFICCAQCDDNSLIEKSSLSMLNKLKNILTLNVGRQMLTNDDDMKSNGGPY